VDSSGSGQGQVAGSCEHDNAPSDVIRNWEFLNQLTDYHLIKNDSAARR
jgi:hypothetical protein